jgi:N-acetylglucosaminyldiphosphoundecaprenol N-acetyl-beta-D-mannosaminyltransferase
MEEFLELDDDHLQKLLNVKDRNMSGSFHLINGFSIVSAHENSALSQIYREQNKICDSRILHFFAKINGVKVTHIRGSDLFRFVISESHLDTRHFFLGGTEEILSDLIQECLRLNPRVKIAGSFSPSFTEDYLQICRESIELISSSKANVLWIGLGSPKQDFVADYLASKMFLQCYAVGAAFDFVGGNKREAPRIIQITGLEWLFRFFQEPKRLGKRYLVGNAKLLFLMLKYWQFKGFTNQ